MLLSNLKIHPSLNNEADIAQICAPLKRLNITYFAHVLIDNKGHFSGIGTNPGFAYHYLTNKYYNADIHLSQATSLGDYVVWDAFERKGKSAQMHMEAGEFGVKHTFTIIENDQNGKNYYHFASDLQNETINQIYITNLDLLKLFIMHFKEKMQKAKDLFQAYTIKFNIDENAEGFTFHTDKALSNPKLNRSLFLQDIAIKSSIAPNLTKALSAREMEILTWLHYGKKSSDIASILDLAEITVNKHMANIKEKTQCYTQFQLGEFFSTLFHHSEEVIKTVLKIK